MEDERGSHFDPEVLDAFKPMAMELYSACSDSSSQELDVRLRGVGYGKACQTASRTICAGNV